MRGAGPCQSLQLGAVSTQTAPRELGAGTGRAGGAVAQHTLPLDRWGRGQGQHSLGCWLPWRGDLYGCNVRTSRVRSGDAAAPNSPSLNTHKTHTLVIFKTILEMLKGTLRTWSLQKSDKTETLDPGSE